MQSEFNLVFGLWVITFFYTEKSWHAFPRTAASSTASRACGRRPRAALHRPLAREQYTARYRGSQWIWYDRVWYRGYRCNTFLLHVILQGVLPDASAVGLRQGGPTEVLFLSMATSPFSLLTSPTVTEFIDLVSCRFFFNHDLVSQRHWFYFLHFQLIFGF
jgi:hypothetical protein